MRSNLKRAWSPRAALPGRLGPRYAWLWALLALPAVVLALWYPLALADFSDTVLGAQRYFSAARWIIVTLSLYVLVARKLAWWERFALLSLVWGVLGGYAQNKLDHHLYLLNNLQIHIVLLVYSVRLLYRPTPHEDRLRVRELERQLKERG